MNKEKFNNLKRGTIIKIPNSRLSLMKTRAWTGKGYEDVAYDGNHTIYSSESIPDNSKLITSKLLYKSISSKKYLVSLEDWEVNYENLLQIDKKQRQAGKILYRYITFPYADGKAFYQIVEEKSKKVRLMVIKDIGDDWEIPDLPDGEYFDKAKAIAQIKRRDTFHDLMKERK